METNFKHINQHLTLAYLKCTDTFSCKVQKLLKVFKLSKSKQEAGYTLLEYCAGAAIIAGIVWGALQLLGTNLQNFLNSLAAWTQERANEI